MAKGRGKAAKLAHESKGTGKIICPVCNTEIKQVKMIRAKVSDKGTWSPSYGIESVCKCNEKELLK